MKRGGNIGGLEARKSFTTYHKPLVLNNRATLHILESLQILLIMIQMMMTIKITIMIIITKIMIIVIAIKITIIIIIMIIIIIIIINNKNKNNELAAFILIRQLTTVL